MPSSCVLSICGDQHAVQPGSTHILYLHYNKAPAAFRSLLGRRPTHLALLSPAPLLCTHPPLQARVAAGAAIVGATATMAGATDGAVSWPALTLFSQQMPSNQPTSGGALVDHSLWLRHRHSPSQVSVFAVAANASTAMPCSCGQLQANRSCYQAAPGARLVMLIVTAVTTISAHATDMHSCECTWSAQGCCACVFVLQ